MGNMAEEREKVVLTYPLEVWQEMDLEHETFVLNNRGFYSVANLNARTIEARPLGKTNSREFFHEEAVEYLEKNGVGVRFEAIG